MDDNDPRLALMELCANQAVQLAALAEEVKGLRAQLRSSEAWREDVRKQRDELLAKSLDKEL